MGKQNSCIRKGLTVASLTLQTNIINYVGGRITHITADVKLYYDIADCEKGFFQPATRVAFNRRQTTR